jgi:hypothetical protein
MPVDLKQLGPPKHYPPRGPGIRAWLVVWIVCAIVVDGAVLLLWPQNQAARGLDFWLPVAGLPNVLFLAIVILHRAFYESVWLHVMYFNGHREVRRRSVIERGQQAVRVLDYSYRFPLKNGTLARTISDQTQLLKAQTVRDGTTIARRLSDDADGASSDPLLGQVVRQAPLDRSGQLYAQLLVPLANTVGLLLQAGLTPAVRLVAADPANTGDALKQLRTAIHAMGMPLPDCKAIAATDGLMLVDAWLDAGERRPLLVVAAQLHDTPPDESAEGGVALLALHQAVALPAAVTPRATLHRPVAVPPQDLAGGLALSMLWGRVRSSMLKHVWMTGFDDEEQTHVSQAFRRTALERLTKFEARRTPDSVLGYAGVAACWLTVVAAAELEAAAPQLILNRTLTAHQAVILKTHLQTS